MKYIDAYRLKAEIESIALCPQMSADYNDGRDEVKMVVLDLIDTLQHEQHPIHYNLDAEQGIKLHGRILPGTYGNLYIESDCFDRGYRGLNYKFSESNDVDMFVQIRKK